MKKIVVTGATGLVGSRIVELLNNDFEFIPLTSKELDITDKKVTEAKLHSLEYDLLLHLAAYTNVDGAEREKEAAYKLNVDGTRNLLETTLSKNSEFLYISTADFVFDGKNPPYYEDSEPNPLGEYGKSKLEGEKVVGKNGMIFRIQNPYGNSPAEKKDFARILKSLMEQGKELNIVTDSLITPTHIDDIADSLRYLMNNFSKEIFHIVGSQAISPFEAGKLIAKTFHLDENLIKSTTYAEYFQGKAPRPQFADVRSKKNNFLKMRSFEEGVATLK